MNRRAFFSSVLGGFAAAAVAPFVVKALAKPAPAISTSIRFVRHFDMSAGPVTRMDVLYGFGTLRDSHQCRIEA